MYRIVNTLIRSDTLNRQIWCSVSDCCGDHAQHLIDLTAVNQKLELISWPGFSANQQLAFCSIVGAWTVFMYSAVATHTHTHTLTHTHTHAYTTHTLTHTHPFSLTHSHTHTHTHARTYARLHHTHSHTHTHPLSLTLTHSLSLTPSLSLPLTHTHTHTPSLSLSHIHTHTLSLSLSLSLSHTHTHTLSLSLSLSHTHSHTHTRSGRSSVHKSRRSVAVNHISTWRFALWSSIFQWIQMPCVCVCVCVCVCSRVSSARTWFLRSASTCARSPKETSPSRSGDQITLQNKI